MHNKTVILNSKNINDIERDYFVSKYPELNSCIKLCLGAVEYINNKKRYCLWLDGVNPSVYVKNKDIMLRIEKVREQRLKSTSKQTREKANIPHLFTDIRQPKGNYLIVPSVSSHRRKYVPIGFMTPDVIATNLVLIVPDSSIYEFGIITSNVHMAWLRTVGGRLKSDYRYSANIVYNNFPWPDVSPEQKSKIEQTAQAILDARAKYPEASLADLYGEYMYLYPELLTAHQNNDKAVMEAYGFRIKENGKNRWLTESETVAELMKMYQELIK